MLTSEEKSVFVKQCEAFLGVDYSLSRMYTMIIRTVAEKQFRVGRFLPKMTTPASNDQAWLCMDAVVFALLKASPTMKATCDKFDPPLDYIRTGSASTSDILRMESQKLLQDIVVRIEPNKTQESTAERLKKAWDEAGKVKVSLRTLGFALMISSFFNKRIFLFRVVLLLAVIWAFVTRAGQDKKTRVLQASL